jgi:DNA-binding CsgD family transcriptional regulator
MVDARRLARATRGVELLGSPGDDPDSYFERFSSVLAESGVPFIGACWHLTDPSSGLATWIGFRGELPGDLHSAFENEYLEEDVAKYAELAERPRPVAGLVSETDGHPRVSARYRHDFAPDGFADELRIAFVDQFGRWGSMGLFSDTAYESEAELLLAGLVGPVAKALRDSAASSRVAEQDAPGVILLDGEDRVRTCDERASELLQMPLSTGALPGAVHILAARARATGSSRGGRTLSPDGVWLELNASELQDGSVAIVLRPARAASVVELRLRAAGLTRREREIALRVLRGESTATIAAGLHLSPWTVQDHLKAIFDKTDVRSRRAFVARWAFESAGATSPTP